MKTVILAGGLGTRLGEETDVRPKPMVEIGGRPMLWHIMKHYAHYGFQEFVIALGYKGDVIRRYFVDYAAFRSNLRVDLANGEVRLEERLAPEPWIVHLIETGDETNTGGRLRLLRPWLDDEPFFLTYGDGVSNLDLRQLQAFHRAHGCVGTVTAVRPPARFGGLRVEGERVTEFIEKSQVIEGWINGGFFVFEPAIFDYLSGPDTSLEHDALTRLAQDGQLRAFRHVDFWHCMDTLRDVKTLQSLWQTNTPPWKLWS
jgi:glucose-1-phosphate cytidylyltransferase